MKEYFVQSIHLDQKEVQRVICLLDSYIDTAIENEPDETEVENLSDVLMDVIKEVYQKKYEDA